MIIVEGPDGSGKSTLISALRTHLQLEVAPRVVSKDTVAMTDLQDWVNANVRRGFQHKLFDRHRLISEFIYGPILRPEAERGFTDLDWVSESLFRFYACQPIIIYCLPPLKTVKANVRKGDDNKVVRDHTEQIYTAYVHRIAMDRMARPTTTLIYDYTVDRVSDVPLDIQSMLPWRGPRDRD